MMYLKKVGQHGKDRIGKKLATERRTNGGQERREGPCVWLIKRGIEACLFTIEKSEGWLEFVRGARKGSKTASPRRAGV